MGIGVIGGMLAASFIAIFLIPVTFYVVERLVHRGASAGGHTGGAVEHVAESEEKGGEHA
jgi:HAE1 family hydrophobic/amphiphilic exporter-1